MALTGNQIGPQHAAVYQYRVLRFAVHRTAVQLVQQPMLLLPVQPAIITNIVGVKWFHPRCRAGFSTTRARRPVVARTLARHTVRPTLGAVRLSGPRCSAICPIKCGGKYETNFYIIFCNYAVCIICRRTVNIVPIGLYHGGGRIYEYCGRFVSHRIHIRRHGNQLFGIKPIWFMHYVCTGKHAVY